MIELLGVDDLHKLFYALLIEHKVVDKVEKSTQSSDVNLQAKAVLRFWRKRELWKATRQRVLNALRSCDNIEAVQRLEDIWGGKGLTNEIVNTRDYTIL